MAVQDNVIQVENNTHCVLTVHKYPQDRSYCTTVSSSLRSEYPSPEEQGIYNDSIASTIS